MASEPRTVFPCNTCSLTYTTSALQRAHMQQPWHVFNLKRKVDGLPSITEQEFEVQEGRSEKVSHRSGNTDDTLLRRPRRTLYDVDVEKGANSGAQTEHISDDHTGKAPSTQCLFCPFLSSTHTTALEHMSTVHGLFIPSPSALYSLDSLLSYLAILVFEYHECLYCGQEKSTVDAVQTHMRDKGHCMIDMSELRDFWDLEADQQHNEEQTNSTITELSKTERRLPSRSIINSRHSRGNKTMPKPVRQGQAHSQRCTSQRSSSNRTAAITQAEYQDPDTPVNSSSRQLALNTNNHDPHLTTIPRTAKGLAGLSDQQILALQMVDRRMKSREESAKARVRYAAQQQPVKTIYYKTENPVYQAG
ncbi:hypothetical protein ACET3X_009132 [Alternaria dauci]|uniref:C2H2-type domain-containing protein n=1 Tax=Alternaria dauci TaxID=48095 RepID=A0ABR3U8F4_9PLEO